MNDEIKEILSFSCNADYKRLSCDEIAILKDYITNLQQENQELNDSVTWWNNRFNAVQRDYEELKQENERLKEKNKMLQEDAWRNNANLIEMVKEELEKTDCEECEIYEDYKSRIEKAVEYIKEQYKWIEESDNRWQPVLDNKKILDILNGKE